MWWILPSPHACQCVWPSPVACVAVRHMQVPHTVRAAAPAPLAGIVSRVDHTFYRQSLRPLCSISSNSLPSLKHKGSSTAPLRESLEPPVARYHPYN